MRTILENCIVGIGMVLIVTRISNAQWFQINCSSGSAAMHLEANGSMLYAYNIGLFRSTNNGDSWTAINSGFFNDTSITAVAINGDTVFAATFDNGGVYISTNNGTIWEQINTGLTTTFIHALAVKGSNLFAGTTDAGVFLSTNNGLNWGAINNNLPIDSFTDGAGVTTLATVGTNILAGVNGHGIYRSSNNGNDWTKVSEIDAIAFATQETNVFACGSHGIFISTDSGLNWTGIDSDLPPVPQVLSLTLSGADLFAGTAGKGIFFSNNNGTNWTAINSGLPANAVVHSIVVHGEFLFISIHNDPLSTVAGVWRLPLSDLTVNADTFFHRNQFKFNLNTPTRSDRKMVLHFILPYKELISVKMYDLSGNRLSTIINKQFGAGTHNVSLDNRNISQGCFMVRITVGSKMYSTMLPIYR